MYIIYYYLLYIYCLLFMNYILDYIIVTATILAFQLDF